MICQYRFSKEEMCKVRRDIGHTGDLTDDGSNSRSLVVPEALVGTLGTVLDLHGYANGVWRFGTNVLGLHTFSACLDRRQSSHKHWTRGSRT